MSPKRQDHKQHDDCDDAFDDYRHDYRLADYKPLLPIKAGVRVRLDPAAEQPSLPRLATELDAGAAAQADDEPCDLVVGCNTDLSGLLKPGGQLCLLGEPREVREDLRMIGRWRALPGWPAFRALVPDHPAGYRAAFKSMRLLPARSPAALLGSLSPSLAARLMPKSGLALYARGSAEAADSLLARADRALGGSAFQLAQWLIVSGRLGPGNPILAFQLDSHGRPRRLIKLARDCGAEHLAHEAAQINRITRALGPELAQRVIAPTASATIDDRHVLSYDFVPTRAFRGLRWRLQGRAGLCRTLTDWLIGVAQQTLQPADRDSGSEHHIQPLNDLIGRNILPPEWQQDAKQALDWLRSRDTLPTVFEHGDLGIYNLRLLAANGSDFKVLDWGSSTFQGIACGDLLYLLSSTRAPAALAADCLLRYLQGLKLPIHAASALWWSYLARRWAELDSIRPPKPDDPTSGGGLLLAVHAQVRPALTGLQQASS